MKTEEINVYHGEAMYTVLTEKVGYRLVEALKLVQEHLAGEYGKLQVICEGYIDDKGKKGIEAMTISQKGIISFRIIENKNGIIAIEKL